MTPTYLARAVPALGALLLAGTAAAEPEIVDERVYAPAVWNAGSILTLEDTSERGVLVELRLHHTDGAPLRYGRHPVRITRAVPPRESMAVDLEEIVPADFDGSFELSASGDVTAVLETDGVVYPLVPALTAGELDLRSRGGDRIELAIVAVGEPCTVTFEELIGESSRSRPGRSLDADHALRFTLELESDVSALRWSSDGAVAIVAWDGSAAFGADRPTRAFPLR